MVEQDAYCAQPHALSTVGQLEQAAKRADTAQWVSKSGQQSALTQHKG